MIKLLLIVNPVSGKRKAVKYLADIISVFNQAGSITEVYITDKPGDATHAVKKYASDMDLVVCCGGDGTLNETITGILEAGLVLPVGYIPTGTTNDFANTLNIPSDPIEAAKRITERTPCFIDVGTFNERFFCYTASFGAFTKTSYSTPQNIKNILGHTAYLLEGIQELSQLRKEHITIRLDGEIIEDDFIFGAVCNSTRLGGILTIDPSLIDMSDGKFEVIFIRAPRNLQELHDSVMALRTGKYNCATISFRSTDMIEVIADPKMVWTLDGEKADGASSVLIKNICQGLQLIY